MARRSEVSSRVRQKQANRFVREQLARERRRRRTVIVSIVAVAGVIAAGLIGFTVYQVQKPKTYVTPAHATSDQTGIAVSSGKVQVDIYLRSEEHTSELQSLRQLVCRLLLEKKKHQQTRKWSPNGYRRYQPIARLRHG